MLSKQAAAAGESLPESATIAPWLSKQTQVLPHNAKEALAFTRNAYAICATTTADWMGICAGHSDTLCRQSLDAVVALIKITPGHDSVQTASVRQTMESAYRAYQSMLGAFRNAAESLAKVDAEALATAKRAK